jgi:hypothetical protein
MKIVNNYAGRVYCWSLFILIFTTNPIQADKISLEEDIADGYLEEYSKIEAAFILSGITDPDSLQRYLLWYENLISKIKSFSFDFDDPLGSAQTVFLYLHSEWLITYALESTTLADIVRKKEYNCVAATILYNIICEELDWACKAFETPTHVYTIFITNKRDLIVENTSSMGFDMMKNLKSYSRYLAQYYPQSEVLRIGLDRLYYHENSKGRVITNTELLGLLAYNRAYLAKKNKDFGASYEYVILAQQFNRDSRSNVNFEIGLYYAWGNKLYSNKQYMDAFTVFADGYYRYPDNDDFVNNTVVTFFKSMERNWNNKNWPESARLIEEISVLEILKEKDRQYLRNILLNWQRYYINRKDGQRLKEVEQILSTY